MNVPRRRYTNGGRLLDPERLQPRLRTQPSGERVRVEPQRDDAEGVEPDAERLQEVLQRLQADFINYKRRVEREREEYANSANKELILKLLPVVDDLERALEALPDEAAGCHWGRGVGLVWRKLMAILEEEGVSEIEAAGKDFDPWEHEAVFCDESADGEEGKVKSVVRHGYRLGDTVIRPAQVVVSCGKEKPRQVEPANAE
jgi:molecular chaperone GrpE